MVLTFCWAESAFIKSLVCSSLTFSNWSAKLHATPYSNWSKIRTAESVLCFRDMIMIY